MADAKPVVPLSRLSQGLCQYDIVVKVDRIIYKEVFRYPAGPNHLMKEQVAVHIVVFDETLDRMLIVLDDSSVTRRFGRGFLEEKVYKISDFMVRMNIDPVDTKYHLNLLHTSVVQPFKANMPEHCWDIITVPHVLNGLVTDGGLFDVCGYLVSVYESEMGDETGWYGREVIVLLEDNGVFSVGDTKVVACVMKGVCAETTMAQYKALSHDGQVFVVIQYARIIVNSTSGEPSVISYLNATRAFFNPVFPDLHEKRKMMLSRTSCEAVGYSVPIM